MTDEGGAARADRRPGDGSSGGGGVPDGADVFVPAGGPVPDALARTSDLGVGAHPDDLEFMMLGPIAHCRAESERSFTGITCTDGAGSARSGPFAGFSDEQMVATRREEQRAAARVGAYGAMVQLGHPSGWVRGTGFPSLVEEVAGLLLVTRPANVYTHNLADKHSTHLAVGLATVLAIRSLDPADRPHRLVGIEGWRSLDWLADHEKVLLDTTGLDDLAERLAACFPSQIEGGKRYDLAELGRRRANATLREPRAVDDAESMTVAMDLTPLIRNDELDPVTFVVAAIDRLRADVAMDLGRLLDQV